MVGLDDILATVGIVAVLNKIADAFSDASDKATEFETNVAMVSTVADTTVLSADQLSTQISGLSKDTAKNVNELADATYNAISAGVATAFFDLSPKSSDFLLVLSISSPSCSFLFCASSAASASAFSASSVLKPIFTSSSVE